MADRYFNPFQGIDVFVPTKYHDDVTRYCQREGKAVIDQSPFPRMVDMWFAAVCVAARLGLQPVEVSGTPTVKIIEGSILSSDSWRVHALMLLAVAYTGDVHIVAEPRRMMDIANGLANAGLPKVIEMLREGAGEPIWNLSDAIEAIATSESGVPVAASVVAGVGVGA